MDTREIIKQLDQPHSNEEFKGFVLGKGFNPDYFPENPDVDLGIEKDWRGPRTLICANQDEVTKARMEKTHASSKRKKTGYEPSRLESFMTNREKNLVSIEFAEASEKKPKKIEVTFSFSDGNKESKTFDEDEVREIKAKYLSYIKEGENRILLEGESSLPSSQSNLKPR